VSLGLSAFMVDVNQMSLALRSATSRSLLLVDEFGKGTSEIDGQALLAACLKNLLDRGHSCPLTLVSTHFYNIRWEKHLVTVPGPSIILHCRALLGPREDVAYNTFDHMEQDENIVYLYKLKSGLCTSSQAHVVARRAGVEAAIIERSNEVLGCLRQGKPIKSSPGARFTKNN
jgi:DNA mismatch repair protein MSH5